LIFPVSVLVENLSVKVVFESEPLCFVCRILLEEVKKLKKNLKKR